MQKKGETPPVEKGAYVFVGNNLHKLKTPYEKMLQRLKPGEIQYPKLGGESLNTFFG